MISYRLPIKCYNTKCKWYYLGTCSLEQVEINKAGECINELNVK